MRSALALLCLGSLLSACNNARPDPSWVEIYDPAAAVPSYHLALFERRVPMLMDLNGNAVHVWHTSAASRARLLPDGGLLMIGADDTISELDWEGRTRWRFRLPGEDFPHHDLIPLRNGNRLVLAHDIAVGLDYLLEVDSTEKVVWEWRARDHLGPDLERARELLARGELVEPDLTHINSLQELPSNRWFDAGDLRFRPGNILISARNLNTLYVLDRDSGDVTWRYDQDLDHQHEAAMIPPGVPGEGNIAFFNNGLEDRFVYRRSAVVEIDPVTAAVVWSYRAPNFFSSTAGTQQSLGNGNVMVTSSRGGRAFEVTRDGRIVWQWTPPFRPMRDHRYPLDYCPQLAELPRPRPRRIDRARPHVDRDLYDFDLGPAKRKTKIDGKEWSVLETTSACRELILPERAELVMGYGFEPRHEAAGDANVGTAVVLASVRLTPLDPARREAARTLLEREVRPGRDARRAGSVVENTIDLSEYELETVELCFEASAPGGLPPDGAFVWTRPEIHSGVIRERGDPEPVDAARRALEEKHLKALGYVD